MNTQQEFERLSNLRQQLGHTHTESVALQREIEALETAHGDALRDWTQAGISGADPGPMPPPPAEIVTKRNRLSELQALDRSTEQARAILDDKLADLGRQLQVQREQMALARYEALVDITAKESAEIDKLMSKATIHLARIFGVHKLLVDEANRRGGSGDPAATPYYRILQACARPGSSAVGQIEVSQGAVDEAARQLAERLQ